MNDSYERHPEEAEMHPDMERELAAQRIADLRRSAAPRRERVARKVKVDTEVVLRGARDADRSALAALAALDGTLPPVGPALVAEVDGSIRAVVPLDGGRPYADPFRRTGDLVALLEERARQISEARRARAHGHRLGLVPALRRLV
jgi:hypothetical protein